MHVQYVYIRVYLSSHTTPSQPRCIAPKQLRISDSDSDSAGQVPLLARAEKPQITAANYEDILA